RGYGAETIFASSMETVYAAMEEYRTAHEMHYVHPFSDPHVIAGQGTVGLEILEDAPDVDVITICTGGGGLLAGIAVAVKALQPGVRIVGVEPEGAPAVTQRLAAGIPVNVDHITTIADGLSAPFGGALSQALIERNVDDVVLVSDEEIMSALRLILERTKLLSEPAGAAGVAALLAGKAGVEPGARAVATLSGGNIDLLRLKNLL
ncbi:MAG: pyridoxal-phosphate dependent enzyme, partial [Thermomicrobiales bacterium]